ncbi:hypothetical protein NC651_038220 [Populus alba x Populus x berolinensis]|nr:hypothetical protein NC651_038220 [Populus alba x Populus x berolinensis]
MATVTLFLIRPLLAGPLRKQAKGGSGGEREREAQKEGFVLCIYKTSSICVLDSE